MRALAHDIIVIRQGIVVEAGKSDEIFDAPKEAYPQALMKAAFEIEADDSGVVSS